MLSSYAINIFNKVIKHRNKMSAFDAINIFEIVTQVEPFAEKQKKQRKHQNYTHLLFFSIDTANFVILHSCCPIIIHMLRGMM